MHIIFIISTLLLHILHVNSLPISSIHIIRVDDNLIRTTALFLTLTVCAQFNQVKLLLSSWATNTTRHQHKLRCGTKFYKKNAIFTHPQKPRFAQFQKTIINVYTTFKEIDDMMSPEHRFLLLFLRVITLPVRFLRRRVIFDRRFILILSLFNPSLSCILLS